MATALSTSWPSVQIARALLAAASASLALWILAYGHLAPQPLPAWTPWRGIWVYGSAVLLLAATFGLCVTRTVIPSILTVAAYLAADAAISVPQIVARPLGIDAWYPFCESLTPLAGAWTLFILLRMRPPGSGTRIDGEVTVRIARVLFGLTCVFYGVSHFAYAGYTASMVPGWLPNRLVLAYITGTCHIAAGLALIVGIQPRLAATLEAAMMSAFGALVWVPSFFTYPRPSWATPPEQQWSELVVTLVLAMGAWIVAISLADRPWAASARVRAGRLRPPSGHSPR